MAISAGGHCHCCLYCWTRQMCSSSPQKIKRYSHPYLPSLPEQRQATAHPQAHALSVCVLSIYYSIMRKTRIGSLALPCLHCNPSRCAQCPVSPWDWAQQVPELHLCLHSVIRTLHILTESFLLRYAGMAADIYVFMRIFSNSIQWIKLIYKIWSKHNTGLKVSSHRKYLNY